MKDFEEKDFTMYRMIRFSLVAIFIMFSISMIFGIGIASAESGTLTINAGTGNSYTPTVSGSNAAQTINWSEIEFDVANYNSISSVTFHFTDTTLVYPNASNTGSFVISELQGNTGYGFWDYDSSLQDIHMYFYDTNIVSSPIVLNGMNINLYQINTALWGTGTQTVSASQPVKLRTTAGNRLMGYSAYYYSVISQTSKTFSNNYDVSYHNDFVIVNVSKNMSAVSSKIIINNLTARKFIEPSFNKAFLSYGYIYDNGLIINMTDASGNYDYVIVNSTNANPPETPSTNISGTINTNKDTYNQTETILYNTTLSNANCGLVYCRVIIWRYQSPESYDIYKILEDTTINNGIYNKSYYINSYITPYTYSISLEVYQNNVWEAIAQKYITINGLSSSISFENLNKAYNLGENIRLISYSNTSGYVSLYDSGNNLVYNHSVNGNVTSTLSYYLTQNDLVGQWEAKLYNNLGVEVDNDFAIINFVVIPNDNVTITTTPTQPVNLLDVAVGISDALIGQQTDENGIVSDIQIQKTGNKMFSLLLLLVLSCFLAGTYHTIMNHKKR